MAITDIAEATKISEGKIRATVERMTEAGLIETVGAGKGRMYILSAKAYRNVVSYVRQTDIETLRYQELVLKLVEVQGTVSRKDVVELLHVSPSQAYRILQKMVKDKVLMQEGTTRTARYRKV